MKPSERIGDMALRLLRPGSGTTATEATLAALIAHLDEQHELANAPVNVTFVRGGDEMIPVRRVGSPPSGRGVWVILAANGEVLGSYRYRPNDVAVAKWEAEGSTVRWVAV